jgi:hypothetical protein
MFRSMDTKKNKHLAATAVEGNWNRLALGPKSARMPRLHLVSAAASAVSAYYSYWSAVHPR